jgi:hypothetical protein
LRRINRNVSSPHVSYAFEKTTGTAPVYPGPRRAEANGEDHDRTPDISKNQMLAVPGIGKREVDINLSKGIAAHEGGDNN